MTYDRWYPTVTKLGDGRMLVVSGAISCPDCSRSRPPCTAGIATTSPRCSIRRRTRGPPSSRAAAGAFRQLYPNLYLLPDGRVFAATSAEDPIASRVLDVATQTWSVVDPGRSGTAEAPAMYLPGKIIKSGSARNPD